MWRELVDFVSVKEKPCPSSIQEKIQIPTAYFFQVANLFQVYQVYSQVTWILETKTLWGLDRLVKQAALYHKTVNHFFCDIILLL